jgi:hypothetical protein
VIEVDQGVELLAERRVIIVAATFRLGFVHDTDGAL